MQKKITLLICFLLIIMVSTAVNLAIYNIDYLINPGQPHPFIGSVKFVGWERDGDRYTSKDDPQIVISNIHGFVDTIEISGEFDDEIAPQIYYTDTVFKRFSEETTFIPEYTISKDSLQLKVEKKISSLRIDLYDTSGHVIKYNYLQIYPSVFVVNFESIFVFNIISCIFFLLLYNLFGSKKNFHNILQLFHKYRYLLMNLVKRDITIKYRKSTLGILWSVLNPLLMMIVVTSVFQHLFRVQVSNFRVYYLTGIVIFNFTSEATSASMTSIVNSGSLLRKVYIPKYIFPLEKCLFALINMFFSFLAVLILIPIVGGRFYVTMFLFLIPMLFVLVFCFGFGMILATLNVFFRDTSHIYSILLTAWMYMTPIIYPKEILPEFMLAIVKLNPLYYYIDYFRQIMMYGNIPNFSTTLICLLFSCSFLILGLFVFKKNQDKFILFL